MSAFNNNKPIDIKKEEFRKYLERSGVLDALTKVLVSLYEETNRPDDALGYIRKNLGGTTEAAMEVESLQKELEELKLQHADLKDKLVKQPTNEEAE